MKIDVPCFNIAIEIVDNAGRIASDLGADSDNSQLTAALDAIESLILAHAIAGVDVASPAYVRGIETAVETCWNKLG